MNGGTMTMKRLRTLPGVAVVVLASLAALYPAATAAPYGESSNSTPLAHGTLNHPAPLVTVETEQPN
jgi:hypothetical protein